MISDIWHAQHMIIILLLIMHISDVLSSWGKGEIAYIFKAYILHFLHLHIHRQHIQTISFSVSIDCSKIVNCKTFNNSKHCLCQTYNRVRADPGGATGPCPPPQSAKIRKDFGPLIASWQTACQYMPHDPNPISWIRPCNWVTFCLWFLLVQHPETHCPLSG